MSSLATGSSVLSFASSVVSRHLLSTVGSLCRTLPRTSLPLHQDPKFLQCATPVRFSLASYATKRKMAVKLTGSERETQLKPLLDAGWKMVDGRDAINKTYMFKNFMESWNWMSRIAMSGEKMDHHPEWFNVYNKVEVTWSTHDCGGLSSRDIKMATLCEDTFKIYK